MRRLRHGRGRLGVGAMGVDNIASAACASAALRADAELVAQLIEAFAKAGLAGDVNIGDAAAAYADDHGGSVVRVIGGH